MGIFKIFSILALTAMLIFFAIYFNIYALFIAALVPLIFVFADIFLFLLSKGCVTDISTERNTYSKKSNSCKKQMSVPYKQSKYYFIRKKQILQGQ